MNTLVVAGAGCSKGLAGLPIDNEFMRKLEDRIASNYFLNETLNCLYRPIFEGSIAPKNLWKGERLEVCWNEIDENFNRTKIISSSSIIDKWANKFYEFAEQEDKKQKYYSYYLHDASKSFTAYEYLFLFAGWELRKIAAAEYSKILNESEKALYNKLKDKILSLTNNDIASFISFNYDTLLEQVLGNYSYLALDTIKENSYQVLKPHGSVNWLHIVGERIFSKSDPIPIDEIGFLDGLLHQHSIVGLVANKIEFNLHKQFELRSGEVGNLYADKTISEFQRLLNKSERIIIIGYSFPFTDSHIRNAILKSQPINLKGVVVVDKTDKGGTEKIKSIVSRLLKIEKDKINIYGDGVENWINT